MERKWNVMTSLKLILAKVQLKEMKQKQLNFLNIINQLSNSEIKPTLVEMIPFIVSEIEKDLFKTIKSKDIIPTLMVAYKIF
jgi:hypothetical protein